MRPAILIAVLAAVAIAAAVAFRYGGGRLDGVVASTIERYGSAVTGTDVDVDGVDLALTAGRADLAGSHDRQSSRLRDRLRRAHRSRDASRSTSARWPATCRSSRS